jgi:BirA family biotin operon repressor/biotin-[acetyl-CoA-carboxylase] ligase
MNIIKLNAINSTNDYLKELCSVQHLDNYTVVVAEHQTAGKGQMGAIWMVEAGKNLTFSILVKNLLTDITAIFDLNAAVAVSITDALEALNIANVFIKWPNDILAGNKKVGGVLIENTIKNNGEISSVVGIGLNVNQTDFTGLPKASSLTVAGGVEYNKEDIMVSIVENLKRNTAVLKNESDTIWTKYHNKLYKKGIPMPFEGRGQKFMGIILGVTAQGSLKVRLEDDTIAHYQVKEVQLLY